MFEAGELDETGGCDPRAARDRGEFLSFEDVEARLVEAVLVTWRMGDREAAWHRVGSGWPQVLRHTWFGDWPDFDATPRPEPLSPAQIDAADAALGWVLAAQDEDRRLIGLAVRALAKGAKQVPWKALLAPMGVKLGADGLRKRYARAMVAVCKRANGLLPAERLPRARRGQLSRGYPVLK